MVKLSKVSSSTSTRIRLLPTCIVSLLILGINYFIFANPTNTYVITTTTTSTTTTSASQSNNKNNAIRGYDDEEEEEEDDDDEEASINDIFALEEQPNWDPLWWKPYVNQIATKPWKAWKNEKKSKNYRHDDDGRYYITGGNNTNNDDDANEEVDPFGWCIIPNNMERGTYNRNSGLYFVKVPKSASSTCAGITIQIGQNVAERIHHFRLTNSTNSENQEFGLSDTRNRIGDVSRKTNSVRSHNHRGGGGGGGGGGSRRNNYEHSSSSAKGSSSTSGPPGRELDHRDTKNSVVAKQRMRDDAKFFDLLTSSSVKGAVTHSTIRQKMKQQATQQKSLSPTSKDCITHYSHGADYVNRESPYLLWTVIRHPTKRALSVSLQSNIEYSKLCSSLLLLSFHTKSCEMTRR